MKRFFSVIIAVVIVALATAATDRFYIADFAISPGETRTVSIMLDNEATYTAFQTDIYVPDGLTIEQEDEDYIFDLTERKGRDHNIASQVQADGAIRVLSYSPGIKSYSGNSGALVTFNVTASDDFVGDVTIALRGTLFTTTAGIEVAFPEENCTIGLKGDVNNDGLVTIKDVTVLINYLLTEDSEGINLVNADVNGSESISISDVTALINLLLNM